MLVAKGLFTITNMASSRLREAEIAKYLNDLGALGLGLSNLSSEENN